VQDLEITCNYLEFFAPEPVLFLFGLLFCFILTFDLTRKVSKQHHQLVTLTQDYALLKQKLNNKEQNDSLHDA
ncbi:hypothetical protein COK55_22515, partial [Bacillus cereus]